MISKLFGAGSFKPTPAIPEGTVLLFGNAQLGYYGRVSSASLITGDELATLCGLTGGTLIPNHSNAEWLKFAYKGKILYVASRNYRNLIPYSDLTTRQLGEGKNVFIKDKPYKVRLLEGGLYDGDVNVNEWDDLIYRVCPSAPGALPKWDTFTPEEFMAMAGAPNGKGSSWTKTTYTYNTQTKVIRGGTTVRDYSWRTHSNSQNAIGWRPVLEMIA